MADNTLNQTAATGATPGHKPAGAGAHTPPATRGGTNTTSTELDLEGLLDGELGGDSIETPDPELDADLPKSKKGKQATEKPKPKPQSKPKGGGSEESEEDVLNSALEEGSEDDEPESEAEVEGTDEDEERTEEEPSDEELEAAMPENSDEIDPENPPKGLENVPKPVWKRIKKQSEQLRSLKAQLGEGAIQLTPTPDNPLADVAKIEELDERVARAREDRKWARENPEGGPRKVNGKTVEMDAEGAAKLLADAEAVIDADATTRTRLMFREQQKPWEAATAVEPELFVKGTPANTFLLDMVGACPEITKHPEWEKLAAYAVRGARMVLEERSGKAKYVRFEVGPDGKLLPFKPKKTGGGTDKAGADKAKPKTATATPPPNPSAARPPLTRKPQAKENAAPKLAHSDADLASMLAGELGD